MRLALDHVSGPEIEVLELARVKRETKEFISVTSGDDDITARIVAARQWFEKLTGLVLVDQTFRLSLERTGSLFTTDPDVGRVYSGAVGPTRDVYLRRSPVIAITSIVTVDADGAETSVDEGEYELREATSRWPLVVPVGSASWGSANIRVTFRAGFVDLTGSPQQDASVVPEIYKQAMILWLQWRRDGKPEDLQAAINIASEHRVHLGFA